MIRLLHVETLQLHTFVDKAKPAYITASHRWTDHEISLQEYEQKTKLRSLGYWKIVEFCNLVRRLDIGVKYLWIDTCCIDKTNSEELSEAITSMYRWYKQSVLCLAYLSDLKDPGDDKAFLRSQWFRRGWTLQELIAPKTVVFIDRDWFMFGYKGPERSRKLGKILSKLGDLNQLIATGNKIPVKVLLDREECANISDRHKWLWAENRDTFLVEDQAYCLMGIFGVSIDKRYGEGEDAMSRLKVAIKQRQTDKRAGKLGMSGEQLGIFKFVAGMLVGWTVTDVLWKLQNQNEMKET